ncbi:MAG: hypothetical protein GEU97_03185 [Actinophytocola sp.]|nr:hypothetical protein [Actinophytocola sp.]
MVVSASTLAATVVPVAATGSVAEPAAPADCPDPFPIENLAEDQPVTGLTVSRGTEPDDITGEIVGTLEDGIAPGIDMIIAKLSGSEITNPDGSVKRGIWAGMSGSPVYAEDGSLIGAVSYGLSWSPSDYAGITPAAEMYRVRDYGGAMSRRAKVPASMAKTMQADGASTAQTDQGFRRLRMPIAVSGGLSNKRIDKAASRFDRPAKRLIAGPGARLAEEPTDLIPGGNLAGSLSYGDMSLTGTGTATALCDDGVLAFGHPFLWSGESTLSMHGAKALYIETDQYSGSYKIANPTGRVGQITQDRLAAILGVPGMTPPTTSVRSHVTATNGNERDGTTKITQQDWTDYISALHLLVNQDRVFDRIGKGSSQIRLTVDLTTARGDTLRFSRPDVFASRWDISFNTVDDVWWNLYRIMNNKFAKVEITDVNVTSNLDDDFHALRLGKVQRKAAGRWVTLNRDNTVRARAGSTLKLRTRLLPRGESVDSPRWVRTDLQVPHRPRRSGTLSVRGGGSMHTGTGGADSLEKMLRMMRRAPHNNDVVANLRVRTGNGPVVRKARGTVASHTTGWRSFDIRVIR